jgi:hypothetical protein
VFKGKKGVNLSIREAEYVAISKAVKEITFGYYVLGDIHMNVKLSISVKTNNIGAIYSIASLILFKLKLSLFNGRIREVICYM